MNQHSSIAHCGRNVSQIAGWIVLVEYRSIPGSTTAEWSTCLAYLVGPLDDCLPTQCKPHIHVSGDLYLM